MTSEAVAATVSCYGGTIEMDGHRPYEISIYDGVGIERASRQLRATDSEGNIVDIALSKRDVRNLMDVLELYT